MKTVYAAFKILEESGGEMKRRQLVEKVSERVKFTDWEMKVNEGKDYERWKTIFVFALVDCIKAGFLIKNRGAFFLTEEGKDAMKFGEEGLYFASRKGYETWKHNKDAAPEAEAETEEMEGNALERQEANIGELEEQATDGIKEFVGGKNAYEFQDIVAALLRAMGYYTPFISPRGRDGGVDIIAYADPLGATSTRIKVQVKHTPNDSVSAYVVRGLLGVLNKDSDVGLIVTSGAFTADAEKTARESQRHMKLISGSEFIELWQKFYPKMPDDDKNLIPLHSIYFLGI
jgi:restriction system protein